MPRDKYEIPVVVVRHLPDVIKIIIRRPAGVFQLADFVSGTLRVIAHYRTEQSQRVDIGLITAGTRNVFAVSVDDVYVHSDLFTFDGFFIVRVGILVFGGTQSPAVRIHFVQLHVLIIRLDKQHLKTPDATENQNREQKEVHPHSVLQFFGFSTHASNL